MLSPHEISTLMLVGRAPDQVDSTRAELGTLLASKLVSMQTGASGWRPALTAAGERVLAIVKARSSAG